MGTEQRGSQAEVEDNKPTLCTSPPGCYLCRNSSWREKKKKKHQKTVLSALLCRALEKECMIMGKGKRWLFIIWEPQAGARSSLC